MEQLKNLILRPETTIGRYFAIFIQILIIASLIGFSIETLPEASTEIRQWLDYLELFVVVIFTAEYLLRILLSEKKLSYIFSFYGIIDLLAIIPFYLSGILNLQALRILRLLALLKFTRYNHAIIRVSRAIWIAKDELILFGILSLVLLYVAAFGIYHFEHNAQPDHFRSIFDCLWWAVATLTTVGYGDIYPITIGGRLFTFVILMIGLGIIAVPTGIVASALSAVRKSEENDREQQE